MGFTATKNSRMVKKPHMSISRKSDREKDLEILVLRHQLDVILRTKYNPLRSSRAERMTLAVLTAKLKKLTDQSANQLRGVNTHRLIVVAKPAGQTQAVLE